MTSFVLSPRTLERAYRRPFLSVFGKFEPKKCCRQSFGPQKRHFLTSQRVFWDISREIPCTGCFSRRVRGKNKNKKETPYISRISPGAPLRPIGTNFGLHVRLVDIINCAKFYRNQLRGLDSMSGQIWPFPLDCDIAVNTVWTTVHTVIVPAIKRNRMMIPYSTLLVLSQPNTSLHGFAQLDARLTRAVSHQSVQWS